MNIQSYVTINSTNPKQQLQTTTHLCTTSQLALNLKPTHPDNTTALNVPKTVSFPSKTTI